MATPNITRKWPVPEKLNIPLRYLEEDIIYEGDSGDFIRINLGQNSGSSLGVQSLALIRWSPVGRSRLRPSSHLRVQANVVLTMVLGTRIKVVYYLYVRVRVATTYPIL